MITEALLLIEKRKVYSLHRSDVEGFFEHIGSGVEDKVDQFYMRFLSDYSTNIDLMNALYDAVFSNRHQDSKRFMQLFLIYNKSVQDFSRIQWTSRSGSYSDGVIISDLEVQEWEKILAYVDEMEDPLTYIPHRDFIREYIDLKRKDGEWERRDNFFKRTY